MAAVPRSVDLTDLAAGRCRLGQPLIIEMNRIAADEAADASWVLHARAGEIRDRNHHVDQAAVLSTASSPDGRQLSFVSQLLDSQQAPEHSSTHHRLAVQWWAKLRSADVINCLSMSFGGGSALRLPSLKRLSMPTSMARPKESL
ncbi:MAG: hypothetical protein R3F65_16120 [bacterium]